MTLSDFQVPAALMAANSPLSTSLASDQFEVLLANTSEAAITIHNTWGSLTTPLLVT